MVLTAHPGGVCAQDDPGAPEQSSGEQGQSFDVWEYQVAGNTLLDTKHIEHTVYPYLGPDKTIEDVEAARAALETLYRNSGYPTVLVDIPEQSVTGGLVKLLVTEGSIDRVRITGSRYFSLGRIRARVPALARGEVPYLPDLQEQLAQLNQITPDRAITPVLKPGRTPGTVEVELKVKDQLPLHGSIEVNDRNSIDTSRTRVSATLSYDNLWQKEHSLSVFFQTAPENSDESRVWTGTYVMRLDNSNNILVLYAVDSASDVATAGTLAVIGSGNIYGTRFIMPLGRYRGYFHSLTLGVDYKDFDETVELIGADTLDTPIKYINFSTQYKGTWSTEQARTSFGVNANFGVRGLVNDEDDFDDKRFRSKANYLYLVGDFSRTQRFGNGIELFATLQGQLSDSALISNEQYSAGGVLSVRGYHESEALGDDAIRAGLELRSPPLIKYLPKGISQFYFLTFIEGAKLYLQDALPDQKNEFELAGTGFGLHLAAFSGWTAYLDFARALQTSSTVDSGDMRAHFKIEYGF